VEWGKGQAHPIPGAVQGEGSDMHADPSVPVGKPVLLEGHFTRPVTVEQVRSLGSSAVLLVRTFDGRLEEVALSDEELMRILAALPVQAPAPRLVPPGDLFLLLESWWIRPAYAYAPYFAVRLSGIKPLPTSWRRSTARCSPSPGCAPFWRTTRRGQDRDGRPPVQGTEDAGACGAGADHRSRGPHHPVAGRAPGSSESTSSSSTPTTISGSWETSGRGSPGHYLNRTTLNG
jgi:hypothetical protein